MFNAGQDLSNDANAPNLSFSEHNSDLQPGQVVDEKYEIVELISAGGMGAVYKALHKKLGKFVAIKVLSADKLAEDVTYRRFEREAKAAAALNHPNVVCIYDCGMIGNNRPYIAMELLDGVSLDQYLDKNGSMECYLAVAVLTQICEALSHAHSRGLIHRDLKPSNIMLVKDDRGNSCVKIIDFGIAKFAKIETKPITKPGQIFGSPVYMSPEQCIGQKLDPRSDIYALGCVFYESLCGQPPFMGDTLLNTIYQHVNQEPASFTEHVEAQMVPARLERIILKMLQKKPEARFQSADEILVALSDYQSGQRDTRDKSSDKPEALGQFFRDSRVKAVISVVCALVFALLCKIWLDGQASAVHKTTTPISTSNKHRPLEHGKIGHSQD